MFFDYLAIFNLIFIILYILISQDKERRKQRSEKLSYAFRTGRKDLNFDFEYVKIVPSWKELRKEFKELRGS